MQPKPTIGDTSWFVHDRFGMFLHWGLYAAAARHEWVQSREQIDEQSYRRYFDHFDPDLYDPEEWARVAAEAGMKYAVMTTKHHEGFCLWDTPLTDYKAPNTPARRDLLRPWVEAFRKAGLKIGFYHSLIDWHHREFPIDGLHPLRGRPDAVELNRSRDIHKYAEYLHAQTRELLTEFGKIDVLFFDFSYRDRPTPGFPGKGRDEWRSEELLRMVRELQPHIIVNNRLDLPADKADIHTPEQWQPQTWLRVEGQPVVWETCQTFGGSWGYHRDEQSWKSPEQLIQMLVNTVSCGGNLLMNVGPTARGTFDQRALDALGVYRDWMKVNSRSIYGCTMSEYQAPADCRFTQTDAESSHREGKRLYLHVYAWPFRYIHLKGLRGKVEYAQLLHDASEIGLAEPAAGNMRVTDMAPDALTLELPVRKPDVIVPVIELFMS